MSFEADEGVHVTRRTLLRGVWALPAVSAVLACARAPAQAVVDPVAAGLAPDVASDPASDPAADPAPDPAADPAADPTSDPFAQFMVDWVKRAQALVVDSQPREDLHLHELAVQLHRLGLDAIPSRGADSFARDGFASGPVRVEAPVMVIEFELDPGACIRPHNHVGFDFMSLGLQGELRVRHFEHAGPAPNPGEDLERRFGLREVSNSYLTRGRTSSLTREHANIHMFEAGPNGARFVDFGVKFDDPGRGPKSFSMLEIDPEPTDRDQRLFTARWIGNPYRR